MKKLIGIVLVSALCLSACSGGGGSTGDIENELPDPPVDGGSPPGDDGASDPPITVTLEGGDTSATVGGIVTLVTSQPFVAANGDSADLLFGDTVIGQVTPGTDGGLNALLELNAPEGTVELTFRDADGKAFLWTVEVLRAEPIAEPEALVDRALQQALQDVDAARASQEYLDQYPDGGPLDEIADLLTRSQSDVDGLSAEELQFAAQLLSLNALDDAAAPKAISAKRDDACVQLAVDFVDRVAATAAGISGGVLLAQAGTASGGVPLALASGVAFALAYKNAIVARRLIGKIYNCLRAEKASLEFDTGFDGGLSKSRIDLASFDHRTPRRFRVTEQVELPDEVADASRTFRGILQRVADFFSTTSLGEQLRPESFTREQQQTDYSVRVDGSVIVGRVETVRAGLIDLSFEFAQPGPDSEMTAFTFALVGEPEILAEGILNVASEGPTVRDSNLVVIHGESVDGAIDAENFTGFRITETTAGTAEILDAAAGTYRFTSDGADPCQDGVMRYVAFDEFGIEAGAVVNVRTACGPVVSSFSVSDSSLKHGSTNETDGEGEITITATGDARPVGYSVLLFSTEDNQASTSTSGKTFDIRPFVAATFEETSPGNYRHTGPLILPQPNPDRPGHWLMTVLIEDENGLESRFPADAKFIMNVWEVSYRLPLIDEREFQDFSEFAQIVSPNIAPKLQNIGSGCIDDRFSRDDDKIFLHAESDGECHAFSFYHEFISIRYLDADGNVIGSVVNRPGNRFLDQLFDCDTQAADVVEVNVRMNDRARGCSCKVGEAPC